MGFPLGRYGMLEQLVNDKRKGLRWALEKFSKFKLYVIVLHDPADDCMEKTLIERFEALDQLTGQDMLFFTFIEPPRRWRMCLERDFYSVDTDYLAYEHESVNNPIAYANTLKRRFGIRRSGSALVLTDDLLCERFAWVPTSAESIEDQLLTIARWCTQITTGAAMDNSAAFHRLMDDLKGQHMAGVKSVAELLMDVLSLVTRKMGDQMMCKSERTSKAYLDELRQNMGASGDDDVRTERDMLEYYDALALSIPKQSGPYLESRGLGRECNRKLQCEIEPENRREWLRIEKRHSLQDRDDYFDYRERDDFDYRERDDFGQRWYSSLRPINLGRLRGCDRNSESNIRNFNLLIQTSPTDDLSRALGMYLGMTVENELNCSVVQRCRMEMGIPMPTYFNRHCYKRGNLRIEFNNHSYAINDTYNGELKQLPFGEARYLYAWLRQQNVMVYLDDDEASSFMRCLTNLNDKRNNAVHPIPFTIESLQDMQYEFEDFLDRYWYSLMRIKQDVLQGDGIEGSDNQMHY